MKFGCCLNMIASTPDKIGIEHIQDLKEIGFDYAELPLAEMVMLSDIEFLNLKEKVIESGIRCEVCNNFFPNTMKLTGNDISLVEIDTYIIKALERASSLGVEYIIFGSGKAKNIPFGYDFKKGYEQIVSLLLKISEISLKYKITICIEPLRKQECNIINTFLEGVKLARDVDKENVKVLVDYYHFRIENESEENIRDYGRQYLHHVHLARVDGRSYPENMCEGNYQMFIDALKEIEYNGRISCEAYTEDFKNSARKTIKFLKENFC